MTIRLAEKDPDVAVEYELDWFEELVTPLPRGKAISQGSYFRAEQDTGWIYECTEAGRTGHHYPTLPKAPGESVRDGSAVLVCRHPDDATLAAVQSAAWTVPAGITLDSQSETAFSTKAVFSSGVDGQDYEIVCRMTPSVGNPIDQSVIIPVRHQ